MFLDFLKNFFLKRKIKTNFSNINLVSTSKKIETVGVLIDETYFFENKALLLSLIEQNILAANIQILLFKNNIKKTDVFENPIFTYSDISWSGEIEKQEVTSFIEQKFDLLISYYDTEKAPLLYVTFKSKATFKVGFSSIDNRFNHFMINTNVENHHVFMSELFKYLNILNKI